MGIDNEVARHRKADADIGALFLNRWSPRSFDPDRPVLDDDLKAVVEAARWAPSSYNEQPWRFIVARSEKDQKTFLDLMVEFNQSWAKNAPVPILSCAMMTFAKNSKLNRHALHDVGAAWENMALEAARRGLYMHGMAGFDHERAKKELGLPEDAKAVAMLALGHRGPKEDIPKELQKNEHPNQRRPASESCFEGTWGKDLY